MKRKCNDCGECPYFGQSYDYWGECDEWCEIHHDFIRKECYYSMFMRKVLRFIWKIKEAYYDWCAERSYLKEEKIRYTERIKLGMTEEEYEQFEYDEMIKHEN